MPQPHASTPGYTIGTLAQAAGVNVETVRFYQRKGLMPMPTRPHGGMRRYTPVDLARLRFIKSAQRLGFSLDEIGELLRLDDGTSCAEARRLAEDKLREVRRRLSDLHGIEGALSSLITQCDNARGRVRCPLIEALRHEGGRG
jgi:MerR family mercuric resistance operon transcriptional regulator